MNFQQIVHIVINYVIQITKLALRGVICNNSIVLRYQYATVNDISDMTLTLNKYSSAVADEPAQRAASR